MISVYNFALLYWNQALYITAEHPWGCADILALSVRVFLQDYLVLSSWIHTSNPLLLWNLPQFNFQLQISALILYSSFLFIININCIKLKKRFWLVKQLKERKRIHRLRAIVKCKQNEITYVYFAWQMNERDRNFPTERINSHRSWHQTITYWLMIDTISRIVNLKRTHIKQSQVSSLNANVYLIGFERRLF